MSIELTDPGVERGPALFREINALVRKARLAPRFDPVIGAARLGFVLGAEPAPSDDKISVTASKWGGSPDLPSDAQVPAGLSFIAQINLARLPTRFTATCGLPTGGVLSFFYDLERLPCLYGADRAAVGCMVIHSPSSASFARRALAGVKALAACTMDFDPAVLLPRCESSEYEAAFADMIDGQVRFRAQDEADANLQDSLRWTYLVETHEGGDDVIHHRLAGHAVPVQSNVQLDAEVFSRGLDPGTPDGFRALPADALATSRRFRLLLQVDSDKDLGFDTWSDAGRLYFLIADDDLRAKRFDRVLVHWQTH